METCTSCGDDQAPVHWRGYCHACCLTKPGYTKFLEAEIERLQEENKDLVHRVERMMQVVCDCREQIDNSGGREISIKDELILRQAKIERLQVWERLAIRLWRTVTPDSGDDRAQNALVDFLAAVDSQLETEHRREVQAKSRELEAD